MRMARPAQPHSESHQPVLIRPSPARAHGHDVDGALQCHLSPGPVVLHLLD